MIAERAPDLVILDLGLPGIDGHEVLRQLRLTSHVPVIVLTARNMPAERVTAFDNGANEYVTKPFDMKELLAKVRAALCYGQTADNSEPKTLYRVGDIRVDLILRRVYVSNQEIQLSSAEYRLLATLVSHPGEVMTYRKLFESFQPAENVQPETYVRMLVASLRRKLEADAIRPQYLLTEPGIGYRLVDERNMTTRFVSP